MQAYQATIQKYPLEQKKVIKKTLTGILGWLIMGLIIMVPLNILLWKYIMAILIIADILILARIIIEPIYQYYYYKKYYYDVRPDFIQIRKGAILTTEVILDYAKIQDVFMDQDLFDRIFRLWDVHVSTATYASGIEAHIDGVNHENALAIRELILNQIRSRKQNG
jgi:membrane protein YdbS with pleckstrin-like domain